MRCLSLLIVVSALAACLGNLCTAAEEESSKPDGAETLSAKGTIAAVSDEGVQVKVSDIEGWVVAIKPGETKIEVNGTAEPTYLRSGMNVRFIGEIDAKGKLQDDISEIEVFTPHGKNDLGLFAEKDKGPLAKPLRKFAAGKYQIRGKVTSLKEHDIVLVAGNKKILGTVAEAVEVKVTSEDLDNVHEGDEVSVTGWYYPTNKAADKKPGQAVADQLSVTLAKPIVAAKKAARPVAKTTKKASKNKDREMDESEEGEGTGGPLISDPFGVDKK